MRPLKREIRGKKGIALIMALWIMTILLVVAASFAFMMRTEIKMAKNYRDGMKAHYLALAGVEHAIAKILEDNTNQVDHLYEPWFTTFATGINYTNVTWDAAVKSFGGGTYAVNLSDENSKCDLSWSNASGLLFLMTPKVPGYDPSTWADYCRKVCNVADYADAGSDPHIYPSTAYTGYEGAGCKDNPFDTLREIQKVTGINLSSTGYTSTGYDNPLDTVKTADWERGDDTDMTVYAQDYNTPVGGGARTDIATCSDTELQTATGLLLADCTEITTNDTYVDYNYPWGMANVLFNGGIGAAATVTAANRAAIWEQEMIDIADKITVGDYGGDNIIQGAININTATFYGLMSILEIAQSKAQNIIDVRNGVKTAWQPTDEDGTTNDKTQYLKNIHSTTDNYFEHRGELLYVEGIARDTFQDFADVITVRTDRFRIYSTGTVGGAIRKIEAVVDRHYYDTPFQTPGPIEVLYWSEKAFAD